MTLVERLRWEAADRFADLMREAADRIEELQDALKSAIISELPQLAAERITELEKANSILLEGMAEGMDEITRLQALVEALRDENMHLWEQIYV